MSALAQLMICFGFLRPRKFFSTTRKTIRYTRSISFPRWEILTSSKPTRITGSGLGIAIKACVVTIPSRELSSISIRKTDFRLIGSLVWRKAKMAGSGSVLTKDWSDSHLGIIDIHFLTVTRAYRSISLITAHRLPTAMATYTLEVTTGWFHLTKMRNQPIYKNYRLYLRASSCSTNHSVRAISKALTGQLTNLTSLCWNITRMYLPLSLPLFVTLQADVASMRIFWKVLKRNGTRWAIEILPLTPTSTPELTPSE